MGVFFRYTYSGFPLKAKKEGKMKKFLLFMPLVFLLCFTFSCQQQVEEGVNEEEAQAIHNRYLEARNTVNLDLLNEIIAENVVVHDPNMPQDIIGLDALKEYYSNNHATISDFRMTIDDMIVKGNRTVTVWTLTGINTGPIHTPFGDIPATGNNIQFSGVAIDLIDEGKIVEEWVYFNVLEVMLQFGFTIVPSQPPGPQEEKK
jgi:steroid delta-isomerase-like uncharacterized protein